MTTTTHTDNIVIAAGENQPSTWSDSLHVRGSVAVSNPGVDFLYKRVPQGINPAILLLSLVLVQRPGIWPQVIVEKPASYDEVGRNLNYTSVEVGAEGQPAFSIPVEIVQ